MTTADLRPASGPADPPSSRPRAGVLGGQVYAFRFDPACGEQRVPVPGLTDVPVTADTVVNWAFYADGAAAVHAPHAALAVTIDALFDDGSRLSGEPRVRDRYGFAMTAPAQFAAAWSMPEQWNADTVSLEPWAGSTASIEAVLGVDGLGGDGPVDGFIEVALGSRTDAASAQQPDAAPLTPADRVDTRRGSHSGDRFSRGNTIPITAAPHGFCFLTSATDAENTRWPYRWSIHDDESGRPLAALQFSHQPSPWIGDRGVLQLRPRLADAASALRIVPGTERARPHVYAARVRGTGTSTAHVEMTATSHGGAFRIAADAASDPVGFSVVSPEGRGRITFHDDGTFDGWTPEGDSGWGNPPRAYFAGVVMGAARLDGHTVSASGTVELRVAQSFISVAQARASLAHELPGSLSFDDLRDALRDDWNGLLSAVEVPEPDAAERPWRGLADAEARARIAGALYRLHLYPNTTAENAGTPEEPRLRFADPMASAGPHGDDETGAPVVEGELFVNNGYWDTYRTAWPAFALVDPDLCGRMLDGLLQQARRGGWMARWSAPGYVDSMVGTSSDQIFADAERWGIRFDERAAFDTAWRNACEPSVDPRQGRKGIAGGRFAGYVSSDVPEGMSWSLENAISDAGIACLARRLADRAGEDAARFRAHARYFANRALSYRTLFDGGFFRGKDAAGRFSDTFDPRVWGGDNVETNAWGMSVSAVHDGGGLAELHGGPAGLREHLDRLFAEPETADVAFAGGYGVVIHEQREARAQRSGMCALSNQPAHHIPWMHVHGDRPWRAGAIVHGLADRLFAGSMIGQGFPGDEDNGEMSMWWLWAALGLYPLELASGELRIGSPLFDDIRVRRAGGGGLRVRAHRPHPDARLLVSATLNGTPLERAVLPVDALHGDAELDLAFTTDEAEASASPLWAAGATTASWRPDLTATGGEPIDPAHAVLFDDGAATGTAVRTASAGWIFDQARRVTDVTITAAADAVAGALAWQASDDGESWRDIATTHTEPLLADRTTPFTFTEPVTARMLRVCGRAASVSLRQLELFDLGEPTP